MCAGVNYRIRPSIKKLYVRRRHLGLNALDRINLKYLQQVIISSVVVNKKLLAKKATRSNIKLLQCVKVFLLYAVTSYYQILLAPDELNFRLPKVKNRHRNIQSFDDEDFPTNFRFLSKEQIRLLIRCFQMPEIMRDSYGHKFITEELFLVVLYYLHFPQVTTDLSFKAIFGWPYWKVNLGVRIFLKWMVINWRYLIYDNMKFWLPYLPSCAEKVRLKLGSMGCNFDYSEGGPGTFNVAFFIDNVIWGSCRPGGGLVRDGPNSPRNHPLIQQSFYTGWKMIHGLKWQTCGLPNGNLKLFYSMQ